jgi:hypothetical protein
VCPRCSAQCTGDSSKILTVNHARVLHVSLQSAKTLNGAAHGSGELAVRMLIAGFFRLCLAVPATNAVSLHRCCALLCTTNVGSSRFAHVFCPYHEFSVAMLCCPTLNAVPLRLCHACCPNTECCVYASLPCFAVQTLNVVSLQICHALLSQH